MGSVNHEMVFWTAAEREKLRRHIAELPHPRGMACRLPDDAFRALVEAERTRTGEYALREGDRESEVSTTLIRFGMVEVRGRMLGNYGMKVREHALALIREGERRL